MLIKDIGVVVTGKTPSTSVEEYYGPGYMFVSPTDLHCNFRIHDTEKHITEAGMRSIANNTINGISILVGCIGWDMGNVAVVDCRCATNQQINSITRIRADVNPYYVYYWLKGRKEYLFTIATVTRTPILNKTDFENIDIPLPERAVQDRVVALLMGIDECIENNLSIESEISLLVRRIYEQWFIQCDYPDENGKPYKSSGGVTVWNQTLNMHLPIGWSVGSIVDNPLSRVITNGVPLFDKRVYLPTSNVINDTITDGDLVTYENRELRANMQPTAYSVWFAKMKNSIKHISIPGDAEWFTEGYILSTGFEGIQCHEMSFAYIHCVVDSEYFERFKDTLAHGATQESVNDDDLQSIQFPIPTKDTLCAFARMINPLLQKRFDCKRNNHDLVKLRDFLLPMLLNGQAMIEN